MRIFLLSMVAFLINIQFAAAQIIIGTSPYDPPFSIASRSGEFYGFEITLMNGICKRMHEKCVYKAIPFTQLFSQIQSGAADLAVSAISITYDRERQFLFSLPYLASNARLLTNYDSKINTFHDAVGKRVGVEVNTAFIKLMKEKINGIKLVEYPAAADLFQAVANHNVDLIVIDGPTAQFWVNNNEHLFKLVGEPIPAGIGYGIMANLSHLTLITNVNRALLEMERDGSYLALYERYF